MLLLCALTWLHLPSAQIKIGGVAHGTVEVMPSASFMSVLICATVVVVGGGVEECKIPQASEVHQDLFGAIWPLHATCLLKCLEEESPTDGDCCISLLEDLTFKVCNIKVY